MQIVIEREKRTSGRNRTVNQNQTNLSIRLQLLTIVLRDDQYLRRGVGDSIFRKNLIGKLMFAIR